MNSLLKILSLTLALLIGSLQVGAANDFQPVTRIPSKAYYKKMRAKIPHLKGDQQIWQKWQFARWGALFNDSKWATQQLQDVIAAKPKFIDLNAVHLTLGRVYFQRQLFTEALKEYNQIGKGSDFWLEATEEKAWTYLRMGKIDQAMATNSTLLTPYFDRVISAEPFYLQALLKLSVCDYPAVLETTGLFKKRYKERVLNLESLAQNSSIDKNALALMQKASAGKITQTSLGEHTLHLPYNSHRDVILQNALHKNIPDQVFTRLSQLAREELKATQIIIRKLHVIEAEVIHRVHGAPKPSDKSPTIKVADSNTLVFSHDPKEIWIDELDDLNFGLKNCPGTKGQKL